ncbi:MAG: hypothetical protein LBV69_11035 [Bacteroidales bacterium]|jgi:hypothetical protein|nr:hypothetical protein [Bacteroidales bacterium]
MKKTKFIFTNLLLNLIIITTANLTVNAQSLNYVPKITSSSGTPTFGNSVIYQNSSNYIGIGTTSPTAKLHVVGNSLFDGNATIGNTGTFTSNLRVNGYSYLKRYADTDWNYEQALIIEVNQNYMEPICVYKKETTGALTETFRLYGNGGGFFKGSVGIGIASTTFGGTTYKLAVKGTIISDEITVVNTTSWPDYVFEENYKKMSLSDVENFIKANKHLPEVPSACEVEEDGAKLGEMVKILLKKVEEQTLYIIEMEKRITELETNKEE